MAQVFTGCCSTAALTQWLVGIGATLVLVQTGSLFGWSSPYVAKLTKADSPIPMDEDQASWVAALLNFGRLLGAVVGGMAAQILGSRRAILLTIIPIIIGWTLIFVATSVTYLYASRILSGIGVGMAYTCFPVFIGEVTQPSVRGAIVTVAFVGSQASGALTSVLGKYLPHSEFSVYYTIPCIVAFLLFLYFPDSPHYLIAKARLEDAEKSLKWYRGGSQVVNKEFQDITQYVTLVSSASFKEKILEFRTPYIGRALFLVVMLFIFMQMSGLNSLIFFMESILTKAQFRLFDPAWAVAIATSASALCLLIAVFLIDHFGRRILLIISSTGVAIAAFVLGTHFLLLDQGHDPKGLQYLPIFSVIFFHATFSIGIMTVPSTVQSEIFPSNVKNIASCLCTFAGGVFGFLVSKSYQPLVKWISEAYVFFGHGIIMALVIPFVLIFMPETKGKSLNEIQQLLMNKSKI